MNIRNITPTSREISAGSGYIHKIGTDTYFKTGTMHPTDSIDDFEEVDEIPPYTKAEYEAKVAEMVRERYSASEEFALQRKAINAVSSPAVTDADGPAMAEYEAYNAYVEQCKQQAKDPELYRKTDEPGMSDTPEDKTDPLPEEEDAAPLPD